MALLQRPYEPPPVGDNIVSSKSFFNLIRLKELLGLKVPVHEPVRLGYNHQQSSPPSGTSSFTSAATVVGGEVFFNGHRGLELVGKCFALPTMAVPNEHLRVWESRIRDRLQDELAQCIRRERCQAEFNMVRDKNGRIGPCILLSCWNDVLCTTEAGRDRMLKKMQKKVKKLQSMRGCQYPCKILVDHIELLARLKLSSEDVPGTDVYSQLTAPVTTYVGLLVSNISGTDQECTVGGLVRVGSKIYGLTVAHAFQKSCVTTPTSADASYDDSSDSESDRGTDTDESLFHELNSDRMSMFTTKSRISGELCRTPSNESEMTLSFETIHDDEVSGNKVKMSCIGRLHTTSDEDDSLDWALIEIIGDINQSPNTYIDPSTGIYTAIQYHADAAGALGRKVYVLAGKSGTQSGSLGQSNVQIFLRGHKYLVTQVILTRNLGDSGSWVVQDSKVIGCIIAGREMLPIAYMVPMSAILENLAMKLNTKHVTLDVSISSPIQPTVSTADASDDSTHPHADAPCEIDPTVVRYAVNADSRPPWISSTTVLRPEDVENTQLNNVPRAIINPNTSICPIEPISASYHTGPEPAVASCQPSERSTIIATSYSQTGGVGLPDEHCMPYRQSAQYDRSNCVVVAISSCIWAAIAIVVGLDFALFALNTPQFAKHMDSWVWSPLYGVAYLFAATVSLTLWRKGTGNHFSDIWLPYLVFGTGFILTLLNPEITPNNGFPFAIWRAIAGFGAMRLLDLSNRQPSRWVRSMSTSSLGLGAVVGTLPPFSSQDGPPAVLKTFAVFMSSTALLGSGLALLTIRTAVQQQGMSRCKKDVSKSEKDSSPCFSDQLAKGLNMAGYFSLYSVRYPLLAMEISGHVEQPRRPKNWYGTFPTKSGAGRLAFLLASACGSVLLIATMFLQRPPAAVVAVTSTVLCVAISLGAYCWTSCVQEVRLMESWLSLYRGACWQRFEWRTAVAVILYAASQASVGASSASAVYLLPIVLQDVYNTSVRNAGLMYSAMFGAAIIVEVLSCFLFEILSSLFRRYLQSHKGESRVWKLLEILKPSCGPMWKLNRVIVQLIVKLPLVFGCFTAYLQMSPIYVSDDQTSIWWAVLLLIGSGSAFAIISPSRIASRLVESQIPGRTVFWSYIVALLRTSYVFGATIGVSASQALFFRTALREEFTDISVLLTSPRASIYMGEAMHKSFVVPLAAAATGLWLQLMADIMSHDSYDHQLCLHYDEATRVLVSKALRNMHSFSTSGPEYLQQDELAPNPFSVIKLYGLGNCAPTKCSSRQTSRLEGEPFKLVVYNRFSDWRVPADVGPATAVQRFVRFMVRNPFGTTRRPEWTDKTGLSSKPDFDQLRWDRQLYVHTALIRDRDDDDGRWRQGEAKYATVRGSRNGSDSASVERGALSRFLNSFGASRSQACDHDQATRLPITYDPYLPRKIVQSPPDSVSRRLPQQDRTDSFTLFPLRTTSTRTARLPRDLGLDWDSRLASGRYRSLIFNDISESRYSGGVDCTANLHEDLE